MAKQVVVETRNGSSVNVSYHYNFDADLVGKKERQEVVVGNVTKYWVRVPGICTTPITPNDFQAQKKVAKIKAKKDIYRQLCEEKAERIARYTKMVANWQEIVPTHEDRISAAKILKLSQRAQKKKVCKI
jgi:hypothetical protein